MTRQRERVVHVARKWIGTPYLHQASVSGAGADCLGLIRGIWREVVGDEPFSPPYYSTDWCECSGEELLLGAALKWLVPDLGGIPRPGSVLLFRMREGAVAKHLGVMVEAGERPRFVHAYTGHGVVESPLSEPWARRIVSSFAFPEGN